ncbi:hypothetical protein ACFFP0_27620 [Rhizobium puerariae]|uniref:Uncharacterized protein n=1 Tax=Rhizobium puerariae TaxID=1585791 RepID=A0ABV6AQ16_9HYPH
MFMMILSVGGLGGVLTFVSPRGSGALSPRLQFIDTASDKIATAFYVHVCVASRI